MDGKRILSRMTALLLAGAGLLLTPRAEAASPFDPTWSVIPSGPDACRPDQCPRRAGSTRPLDAPSLRRAMSLGRWWAESPRTLLSLAEQTDAQFEPYSKRVHSERAAVVHNDMGALFWIDAVEAELGRAKPDRAWLAGVRSSGVLRSGITGSAGARLGVEIALTDNVSAATALDALAGSDRESACDVIEGFVRQRPDATSAPALANLQHGYCSDVERPSLAVELGHPVSTEMRIERADRLYGMVRFNAARDELDAIEGNLEGELYCRAEFRRGRTVYRLRKRNDAMTHYRNVVERCADYPDLRIRGLYALGDRAFDTGRMGDCRDAFSQLLADYPGRSHADDAILYLGRVARSEGDAEAQLALVQRAIAEYSQGDMLHEIVWEYLEPVYRSGKYGAYLEQLGALGVPERDDQYFSQGRLDYFAARALLQLKRPKEGVERYKKILTAYPFSFYGYLAAMELKKAGEPYTVEATADAPSWVDGTWYGRPEVRLLSAGLFDKAARLVEAGSADATDDRWRKAAVLHIAGRPWSSHNVVRRTIEGRPWAGEPTGRLVRWHLAWPHPFADAIDAAAVAEAAQNPTQEVRPALPAAIMREESSFIEAIESYAGALGLMQLMPRTALGHDDDIEGTATPERLKTARVNVRVGVDHLHWLAGRFDGHPVLMVSAYNAGAGATGKWLRRQPNDDIALFVEDIPYLQTRNYTKRVIGSYFAYQWLDGVEPDTRVLRPAQ